VAKASAILIVMARGTNLFMSMYGRLNSLPKRSTKYLLP